MDFLYHFAFEYRMLDFLKRRLGNQVYEPVKCLGRGTFGEAWLLVNKQDNKNYVCKSLSITDRDSRLIAMNEVSLLRSLSHENIVRYVEHTIDQRDETLFIVMEYCGGGDMSALIERAIEKRQNLEEDSIWNWILQIFSALEYLHGRNPIILHRDLKPANIFLTEDHNTVKLGDFGVSRSLVRQGDLARTLCGTPQYLSPEILREEHYDHKGDIWAAGCCLYELMVLKPAAKVNWDTRKLQVQEMPRGYSRELVGIAKEMLNIDQALRPDIKDVLARPFVAQKKQEILRPRPPLQHKEDLPGGLQQAPRGGAGVCYENSLINFDDQTLTAAAPAVARVEQDPPGADINLILDNYHEQERLHDETLNDHVNHKIRALDRDNYGSIGLAAEVGSNMCGRDDKHPYVAMNSQQLRQGDPIQQNQGMKNLAAQPKAVASNPDHAQRSITVDPQADLKSLGFRFQHDGVMRDIENGQTYIHTGDGETYEAICKAVEPYIYHLLEKDCNMHKIPVPLDAQDGKEPTGCIYASHDIFDNTRKLLVLIHGSGKVTAGQWSRSLIINESIDAGSQIPWFRAARKLGYAVIMANMNCNSVMVDGVSVHIRRSEDAYRHLQEVWWFVVRCCPAARVAFLAHSQGGFELVKLAVDREAEFLSKTFAVAFADSVRGSMSEIKVSKEISNFFSKHSRNYVPDPKKPPDTKLTSEKCLSPKYSTGKVEHERTPGACRDLALKFIEEEFKRVDNNSESKRSADSSFLAFLGFGWQK